jgi:hypothetical protein
MRKISDIDLMDLNFVVLDNGICIHLADDELEIFSNNINSASLTVIKKPGFEDDEKLFKDGTQVLFGKDNTLYSIKMKK